MDYNVVFEYTKKIGGYAGNRYWTSYKDKEEFKKMNSPLDETLSIVAEDVTDDEAMNLTSLTPEICRLTAAVHEMCYAGDGHIDINLAPYPLTKVFWAINEDRKHCAANGLRLNTSFPFVEIGKENTEKNRLYRYIKETFTNPNGTIGIIEVANALINSELAEIVIDRLEVLIAKK
ncbi:hypothetical protein D4S03_10965 [bacterium]|nr:MAG: hypothetical protein D4S03_10965 [bacterium]